MNLVVCVRRAMINKLNMVKATGDIRTIVEYPP